MHEHTATDPIEVTPVDHASERVGKGAAPAAAQSAQPGPSKYYTYAPAGSAASARPQAAPRPEQVRATVIEGGPAAAAGSGGKLGAAAQVVAGGAIALVGIPMLILPGPGLLAIAGGVVVAANGIKKLRS